MSRDIDLIRIEYKLDLIIRALQQNNLMLPSPMIPALQGISKDTCPVCSMPIRLEVDVDREEVNYSCECSLPVSAVKGISALNDPRDPTKENKDARKRNEQNIELSQLEAPRGSRER